MGMQTPLFQPRLDREEMPCLQIFEEFFQKVNPSVILLYKSFHRGFFMPGGGSYRTPSKTMFKRVSLVE